MAIILSRGRWIYMAMTKIVIIMYAGKQCWVLDQVWKFQVPIYFACHPAKTQIIRLNCDNCFKAYITLQLFSKLKIFNLTRKV